MAAVEATAAAVVGVEAAGAAVVAAAVTATVAAVEWQPQRRRQRELQPR